jgi:hypothetical protein
MYKLILVLIATLLTGCSDARVTRQHVAKAENLCASNGGLEIILYAGRIETTFKVKAVCVNGASFDHSWREQP